MVEDLDKPLLGGEQIGRVAGFVTDDGSVDLNKTYRALELGFLDASKLGSMWASTPRRILRAFMGGAQ